MLLTRTITAIVGIALAVFIINYGGLIFILALTVLALVAWMELARMFRKAGVKICTSLGSVLIVLSMVFARYANNTEYQFILFFSIVFLLAKVVFTSGKFSIGDCVATVFGFFYVSFLFSHFVELRFIDNDTIYNYKYFQLNPGTAYLWLALIGTWASDSFAYFTGRLFGRTKLNVTISPGKTWEGVIGGGIGAIAVSTLVIWGLGLPLYCGAVIGLIAAVVAPLGDLAESAMKRFCNVKDSGSFFPGHGGVLDRFDSLLFVVPMVYYFVAIIVMG
ncbi:MAG: phosphatidate cytidylyltransferase [Negativicutes bacterium]|jgi:phosphatidate cytidylyltransferase